MFQSRTRQWIVQYLLCAISWIPFQFNGQTTTVNDLESLQFAFRVVTGAGTRKEFGKL